MRMPFHAFIAAGALVMSATCGHAADLLVPVAPVVEVVDAGPPPAPRRYLTTYMASYPFGVLREDYTPLGAPGEARLLWRAAPLCDAACRAAPLGAEDASSAGDRQRTLLTPV